MTPSSAADVGERSSDASPSTAGPHGQHQGEAHGASPGEQMGCQLSELFRLLGERHVPDIIHLVLQEDRVRFTRIQDALGISPNTLSDRLKRLVQAGLVTRVAFNEIPPRVEYVATDKARDLEVVFEGLSDWAAKHRLEPVEASV